MVKEIADFFGFWIYFKKIILELIFNGRTPVRKVVCYTGSTFQLRINVCAGRSKIFFPLKNLPPILTINNKMKG